jgi:PPOX class probable F420-dependent enzyme
VPNAPSLDFLDAQRVAHLATADSAGAPHVVPVCFARVDQCVYIVIDEKPKGEALRLKRVRNIVENPRVALVADVYDEDWSRLGWLMVRGRARLVDDAAEHARALRVLRQKYEQYRAMRLEGRPMLAIEVERLTAWGTARAQLADNGNARV